MKNRIQKYLIPVTVTAICLYALYLRIAARAYGKLWTDELAQLGTMEYPFMVFLKKIASIETFPYLSGDYYLVYPFFKIFGYNKWGLAIPHMVITILGFYLLYLIAKRYLKTVFGYLIVFLAVMLNPNLISHALEMRVYAVLPTLSLACLYFSQRFLEPDLNLSKRLGISFFFILVIWFHAYGILILFFTICFCLWQVRNNPGFKLIFKRAFKNTAMVLAVAMPLWFISVFGPHNNYQIVNTFEYIPDPFKDTFGFFRAVLANLIGYRFRGLYLLLLGIVFPLAIPYKQRLEQIAFLLLLIVVPITVILIADVKNSYWFVQRQFIWAMPFFAIFLAWAWESALSWLVGRSFFDTLRGKMR